METRIRSASKSIIWRILGILILATVTYAYTRQWIQTGAITLLHHGIFLLLYYVHERFYLHVDYVGLKKAVFKCITYETILGSFVLGIITLIITGDVQQMTKITLSYISIKHILYVFNEFIWDKIKIGAR